MRTLRTIVVISLVTVALLEAGARLVPSVAPRVAQLEPERIWEDRFLDMMRSGHIDMAGVYQPHPTRGWSVVPNVHTVVDGFTYTTNERGSRSLAAYRPDPTKRTVLAIGDSFTFGVEANDTATWPYLLQARDPRLNVVNLGVGGYGIDQMDLTLREAMAEYHPQLVIVAFIGDDLRRALLSFRDYKKPRFVLARNQLQLTDVPVGPPETIVEEIARSRRFDESYTFRIVRGLTRRALETAAPPDDVPLGPGAMALVTRLFDDMHDMAEREHARFLLTYLSHGDGLFDPSLVEEGEEFLRSYGTAHHVDTLDTRPVFLQQKRHDWVRGHFQARENGVVSDAIYEHLHLQRPAPTGDTTDAAARPPHSRG